MPLRKEAGGRKLLLIRPQLRQRHRKDERHDARHRTWKERRTHRTWKERWIDDEELRDS